MSIAIHPIDVTAYEKGDYLPPDKCEEIVGMKRENKRYNLALVSIGEHIEREWMDRRQEQITVCCEKDGLRICSDDKAVIENRRRRKAHIRGLGRALVRQTGVDVEGLSSQELRDMTEQERVVGAAFLAGGKKAARLALKPHKRQTPGVAAEE